MEEEEIEVSQIFKQNETNCILFYFKSNPRGYFIDFDHIKDHLIHDALARFANKVPKDMESKLKIFYKTIELIGGQLLRCQFDFAYKLYLSLEKQAKVILMRLSMNQTGIELQIIDDANWSFTFYKVMFDKLLNSFIEIYKSPSLVKSDGSYHLNLDCVQKVNETFFLDKTKTDFINQIAKLNKTK